MDFVIGLFYALIIALFITIIVFVSKNETKRLIKKEKKLIQAYKQGVFNDVVGNVKSTTIVKKQKSSIAKCPYCDRMFDFKDGICPSCGATVKNLGDELIVTKIDEHQELLKVLEYRHEEKLKELDAKYAKDRRDNFWLPAILFLLLFATVIIMITISVK